MTGIPDDAISYRIAAVVPCLDPIGPCPAGTFVTCGAGICNGDGTRVVATDVDVERYHDSQTTYWRGIWKEVQP